MSLEWRPIPTTANWGLVDTETDMCVRHIAVRDPWIGEPGSTKYVVSGDGHDDANHGTHDSMAAAQAASVASLPPELQARVG